jgi:hypothetical protein
MCCRASDAGLAGMAGFASSLRSDCTDQNRLGAPLSEESLSSQIDLRSRML